MANFDTEMLRTLHDLQEVAIRTEKHPANAVVIWITVPDGQVFVRSVRGDKGRWYRDLAADPRATLEFDGQHRAVTAVPVVERASIDHVSREYLRKYRTSPYAQSVVRPEVLPTTLRLEPR